MAKTNPEQIFEALSACRSNPKFPSQVDVVGLDSFNGEHQAQKQKLFEDVHKRGLLQFVPGPSGKRTGLGYQITPLGQAELNLLRRQLGVKA